MKISNIGTYNLKIYAEDDCGNRTNATRTVVAKDIPVTLTFECNGGLPLSPMVVDKGTTIDLTTKHTEKTNWSFDGWFDNPAFTGTPITSIYMDENKTVYAKWSSDEYRTYIFQNNSNTRTLGINIHIDDLPDYEYLYGSVFQTYPAHTGEHPYEFTDRSQRPWNVYSQSIYRVVVGQQIEPLKLDYWFDDFTLLTEFTADNLHMIVTAQTESMKRVFCNCGSLRQLDLRVWGGSQSFLTDLSEAFSNCYIGEWQFDNWQTTAVQNFNKTFLGCRVYNTDDTGLGMDNCLDLSNFYFGNATNMSNMFLRLEADYLILSKGTQYVDVSNCIDFTYMFSNMTTQGIFSGAFTYAGSPSDSFMFYNSLNLVGGAGTTYNSSHLRIDYAHPDLGDSPGYFRGSIETLITYHENGGETITPNPQRVVTGNSVELKRTTLSGYTLEGWYLDAGLTEKAGSGFTVRVPVPAIDVYAKWIEPPLEGTHYLFVDGTLILGLPAEDVESAKQQHGNVRNMYVNNPSATTSLFENDKTRITRVECGSPRAYLNPTAGAFDGFIDLITADISMLNGNPNNGNRLSLTEMFKSCNNLEDCVWQLDPTKADVMSVSSMFKGCTRLEHTVLPQGMPNLQDADHWFDGCTALLGNDVQTGVLDLSDINLNKCVIMNNMLQGCSSLTKVILQSDLNQTTCEEYQYIFADCTSLEEIVNVEGFHTAQARYITGFFANTNIEELTLPYFDTSGTTSISGIFKDCQRLRTVYASPEFCYRPDQHTTALNLFARTYNLVGGNGTTWNSSMASDGTMLHIDGLDGQAGLLTAITP